MPKSAPSRRKPAPGRFGTVQQLPSGKWRAFYRLDDRRIPGPHPFPTEAEGRDWIGRTEQLPSGRWTASYSVAGHLTAAPSTFDTALDARRWIAGEHLAASRRDSDPEAGEASLTARSTFAELCERFIAEEDAWAEGRAGTRHEGARLIRRKIIPALGHHQIGDLKTSLIDAAYQDWHRDTPAQARTALVQLRKVLRLGRRLDLYTADLTEGVRIHPRKRKPITVLDPMSLNDLRTLIEQWRERPGRMGPQPSTLLLDVTNIMLATSARIGEAVALRVQDIAFSDERTIVTIAGSIVDGHGQRKHYQAATKTEAGLRSIIVPDWIVPTLNRLVLAAIVAGHEHLFTTATGAPNGPQDVHRQFRAVRDWAGLPDELVPHVFRKTVATIIADAPDGGLDAAALTLGHSRSRVTEQFYAKRTVLAPDMRSALERLAPVVSGNAHTGRVEGR